MFFIDFEPMFSFHIAFFFLWLQKSTSYPLFFPSIIKESKKPGWRASFCCLSPDIENKLIFYFIHFYGVENQTTVSAQLISYPINSAIIVYRVSLQKSSKQIHLEW